MRERPLPVPKYRYANSSISTTGVMSMNTHSTSVSIDAPTSDSSLVSIVGGQAKTTSLIVAEKFSKRHKSVLRAIDNLDCSEDFRRRSYAPSSYINEQGKPQPMYEMTRDGYAFLVGGFRGKEAAHWKEAYIDAFNCMEAELHRLSELVQEQEVERLRKAEQDRIPPPPHTLIPVKFYDATLYLVEHDGKPYVALKPITDDVGMNWEEQVESLCKLKSLVIIDAVTVSGQPRTIDCMSLEYLPKWLYSFTAHEMPFNKRLNMYYYLTYVVSVLWTSWHNRSQYAIALLMPPKSKCLEDYDTTIIETADIARNSRSRQRKLEEANRNQRVNRRKYLEEKRIDRFYSNN